jgi:hypothetical protein
MLADPFAALAQIILGIYNGRKVQRWISLLFQMLFSAISTFLFICGTSLVASKSWTISIGSGMISAALVLVIFFRRSPLTKDMMAVLPADEAKVEINTDIQVIEKGK